MLLYAYAHAYMHTHTYMHRYKHVYIRMGSRRNTHVQPLKARLWQELHKHVHVNIAARRMPAFTHSSCGVYLAAIFCDHNVVLQTHAPKAYHGT